MSETASAGGMLDRIGASPLVALALMEALRSLDTPEELLEDEDLQRSLPRRLGLSDAVGVQIRRYRDLERQNVSLPAREIADLLTLVARRDDAASVFERAGEGLVRRRLDTRRLRAGFARVPLPAFLRERLALRLARQVARRINPFADAIRSDRNPVTLIVEGSFPAACDASGACHFVLGALRYSMALHAVSDDDGAALRFAHPLCELRGDDCCVWRPAG